MTIAVFGREGASTVIEVTEVRTRLQIIAILKAVEAGQTIKDVCREHEISDVTYYQWKSKYGGMQASDIKRLRELEDENRRLKQLSVDLLLEN